MNRIIYTVYFALILIFTGCGNDRASSNNRTNNIVDTDGDGLSDVKEGVLGVQSRNVDSDGDGILDGADVDINGDGTIDNGKDTDGDGIRDLVDVDVDGDGITDNGTDSDGDGINDKYDTIDNSKDFDNDGLPDDIDPNSHNIDTDGDGIPDGADVDVDGDGIADNGKDSDGDGINDLGEIRGGTNPLLSDSDGDGKSDGVEGKKDSDGDGLIDALESSTQDSDNDGVNDEEDSENSNPNNDSDGDGQANIKELTCGSTGNPLDKTKRCAWETESVKGVSLTSVGFIYVPGGFDVDEDGTDEKGFWVSAYQARGAGSEISVSNVINIIGNYNTFIKNNFKLLNSSEEIRGYMSSKLTDTLKAKGLNFNKKSASTDMRLTTLPPYLAMVSLSKYKLRDSNNIVVNSKIGLLTQKQYVHIQKLLVADINNGGSGVNLRNGLLGVDIEVPAKSYKSSIYEFDEAHKEYLNGLLWLNDAEGNVKFDLNNIETWWEIDIDNIQYNHELFYGANSTLDVGMGAGSSKDNYAVVVRGGDNLDLLQGTTGIDSDTINNKSGIGFRGATAYLK